ncbi:MAG: hypothetical protein ACFFD2_07410 [Promethearchaeota archaeon]
MDIILIILAIIQISLIGILTLLLAKRYLSTRYRPTAILFLFFVLFFLNMLFYIPVIWLTELQLELASFLLNFTFILIICMFPLLILFIEGIKGHFLSPLSTINLVYTAFLLGYITIPRWDFVYTTIWIQPVHVDFNILFSIYIITIFVNLLYRLIQFLTDKELVRPKKMPLIAIIGLFIALIGGVFGGDDIYITTLSILIGTSILALAYLIVPDSFFLSNTKINVIMIINTDSKIPYLISGKWELSLSLTAAGLGGVMSLLQEILISDDPPTRLIHGDKGFLMEHNLRYKLTAIIIVDQINDQLRAPLKYALARFIKQYKSQLLTWNGDINLFKDFRADIHKIFRFAFVIPKKKSLKNQEKV